MNLCVNVWTVRVTYEMSNIIMVSVLPLCEFMTKVLQLFSTKANPFTF